MRKQQFALAASMGSIALLSGCAAMEQHGGKIIGGLGGAALGALACEGDPACIAAGLVGGLVLGDLYDKRQERLRQIAEEKDIALESKQLKTFNSDKTNGLELSINEGGMFESGKANLKTKARLDLMAIATVYRDATQKILVIGHSDASGPDAFNQKLSEKRARTVAKLFEEVGVPAGQVYFQGAGESQPIATNNTPGGRAINRRVEVIEIDSEQSLAAYNLERQNDRKYLAHSNRTSEEKADIRKRVKASPVAQKPAASTAQPALSPSSLALLDFGGVPASDDFSQITQAAGSTENDSGGISFSMFSKAVADEPLNLSPCYMDAPRVSGDIQNLATGQKLAASKLDMSEFWPGLNGSIWYDVVNGHGVGYVDLVVAKQTGIPQGRPTVKVYENVENEKTADYVTQPHIESYPGDKGLLLRTYFASDQPIQCMDVVLANGSGQAAKAGVLYYASGESIYESKIMLERLR